MTADELRRRHPKAAERIAAEARAAERARIEEIEEVARPGSEELIEIAKYEHPEMTAEQVARVMVRRDRRIRDREGARVSENPNENGRTTMTLLDDLKGLIGIDAEEDLPESEEIAKRREEVRAEIERLENELRTLRSDEGRRKALQEADGPEDLGRRKRLLRDRIEGLEDLDDELIRRQRKVENAEKRENLREAVEDLPALADEWEEAMAAERAARSAFEGALDDVGRAVASLDHRGTAPEVALPGAQVRRLERLAEHLSGRHDFALDSLRPDEGEEDDRRVIEDVQNQIRRFVGDRSGVDWREAVPPASAGWTNDFSRATGIAEE